MSNDPQRSLFIGLDVGTQSTKGLLVDASKRGAEAVLGRATSAYDLIAGLPAGAAEQHPHTWRDAVKAVLSQLLDGVDASRLGGIGISGQQHGLVVLDGADQVVRPAKLWCDTTTTDEAEEITARAKYPVPTGYTLPKLLWMKRKEPQNYQRVRSVLLPHDYINFLLSGRKFMEAGDASGSGAFDPESRTFDRKLLDWVGPEVIAMFPELVPADLPPARVSASAAAEFGLPEGLPISPGGGDNMMSAIGSGASTPGVIVVSLGTSGTAFCYSKRPIIDPDGLIAPFCDSTGGWLPLLCTMNVTGVTEELRRALGGPSNQELTELAQAVPPGCDGLMLLPYLQGERVPNLPHATGTLLGIRPGVMTPGHLYRAALEGTAFGLLSGIGRMQRLGIDVQMLRVVGGGSKNPLWCQIFADALGVQVQRLAEPESAALGGAIQAAWVAQREQGTAIAVEDVAERLVQVERTTFEPDPTLKPVYQRWLSHFEDATSRIYTQ